MKKRLPISLSALENTFCKLVRDNAHRHRSGEVFRDFCELAALAISNSVDKLNSEAREARYMTVVKKYTPEEVARFPQMLAVITEILEAGMTDCLGRLFMGMDLGDAGKGQFFTPYEISSLMARLIVTDSPAIIEREGFITLNEPAVGAGGMVIATAEALLLQDINYQQSMHVTAVDIDLTACHMAYLQFSLLHIPAIVIHGNALNPADEWSEWLTPAHVLGQWNRKLAQRRAVQAMRELLAPPTNDGATEPEAHQIAVAKVIEKRKAQAEQMALF